MLKRLTINNYALIEALDIEFPDGLIIITGETGAGKSILLGALSLLLGAKADTTILKRTDSNCVVEGEFKLTTQLNGFNHSSSINIEGDTLILRRVISPTGRSRSFINDEPVTNALLSEISNRIIDIHAQHQHLLLTDNNYQMQVLDYYSGNSQLLSSYQKIFQELKSTREKLHDLDAEIKRANTENEFKQFQLNKINEAKLQEGELANLEDEQSKLANAEEIKEGLSAMLTLLRPMGESIVSNLKESAQIARKNSSYIKGLEDIANRLESCKIECKDIEAEIDTISEKIEISPERLQSIEGRIGLIYELIRKYNCSNEQELITYGHTLENDLKNAESSDIKKDELERDIAKLEQQLESTALTLSKRREEAAPMLSNALQEKIRELDMPYAKLSAEIIPCNDYTISGKESIRFMFAANGGENIHELSKIASGGELSRIMLCIKSLMAKYTGMPTMIFDEIDTGVSGKIADKMGKLIGELGENMQIFSITHLPQIASKGKTHILVYKEADEKGNAKTNIKLLDKTERIMEIARLLSGERLSDAAIENAKYLLNQ